MIRPLADPAVRRVVLLRARVGLGDLLASVPALRALRAARPDIEVTFVTWPSVAEVLERQSPYVDEIVSFPGWPGIPDGPLDATSLPGFLDRCRKRDFDLAVQMYGRAAAANAVTEQLGARRVGGFVKAGARSADLATHLPYPERLPEVERHLRLFAHLGVPPGSAEPEFPLRPDDLAAAESLRAVAGLPAGGYVVVHPGATAASRRWPADRFAAVATEMTAKGHAVAVTGVAGEKPLTSSVAGGAGAVDLGGRTGLGSFAALLADAALLIGNDSGPAHLAAALRTPSVAVFLAGDPVRWGPSDRARHRIVAADVTCRPCTLLRCPLDFRCATGVTVDAVVAEAEDVLSAVPATPAGVRPVAQPGRMGRTRP